jgi:hypothetical protein
MLDESLVKQKEIQVYNTKKNVRQMWRRKIRQLFRIFLSGMIYVSCIKSMIYCPFIYNLFQIIIFYLQKLRDHHIFQYIRINFLCLFIYRR